MRKDDIAFGAVIAAFLFGGCVAFAFVVQEPASEQDVEVRGSPRLAAASAVEIQKLEPITVVGYREQVLPGESHDSR